MISQRNNWTVKSQPEAAEFFGVDPETIKSWRAKGMPGKPREYDLQAITAWLRSDGPWRPKAGGPAKSEDLSAEEQAKRSEREAKARLAWLQVGVREGSLLARDRVHEVFTRVGGLLRNAGEVLQRHYGADALDIQTEALDEAARLVSEVLDDASDGSSNGATGDDPS